MYTPPPRTTLFPYTTLFRSLVSKHGSDSVNLLAARCSPPSCYPSARMSRKLLLLFFFLLVACGKVARGDRKSTRLNSSHPSISFAVFCLKKKRNMRGVIRDI